MAFTPATDVIHEMTISVSKTETGADFDVALHDANGDEVHRKKFSVTNEQLGPFNRIGLERSGRTGAAAMFDSVSIRLGKMQVIRRRGRLGVRVSSSLIRAVVELKCPV